MRELAALQERLAHLLLAHDPADAQERLDGDDPLRAAHPDGLRLAALLVARLRFERLVQGSTVAAFQFEEDPAGFAADFRAYHAAVPPRALLAPDEGAAFARWLAERDA